MNQLSIVIPVLNQWNLTKACLHSLAAHTPGRFYSVVVVDNQSSDATPRDCPALLEDLFPGRYRYLRQEQNLNFGPACNRGAAELEAQYVFFLNNDTELTDGWATPLFHALRDDDRLGAVSPLLLYPESRRVQHLGVAFDPNLHPLHLYDGFPESHPAVQRQRNVQAISAAALLMPRELFLDCRGFHEGYRNGSEDLDLCCQLSRRGLRVACEPRSVLLHHTSRTEGRYDHAPDNATLLDKRCRGCFSSDLHRFARKDGYVIRLTDWLEPYLVAATGAEVEPFSEAGPHVDSVRERLLEEPLWEPGYQLVVQALLEQGEVFEALQWQELWTGFFPSIAQFRTARQLAETAGKAERVRHWQSRLDHVQAALQRAETLVARAKENAQWFTTSGEPELAGLYQSWLKRRVQLK